jgi:outer membrane protein OmpA-like peptidoglycan-associated protein
MSWQKTLVLCCVAWLAAGSSRSATPPERVPLCSSLTIVTAITQPLGDYESIKTITSVDNSGVHLKYSNEQPPLNVGGGLLAQKLLLNRSIRQSDLRTSKLYLQWFGTNIPTEVPGTTAIGTSSTVLSALKSKGEGELGMFDIPPARPGGEKLTPSDVLQDYEIYKLHRVESAPVMVPVLLNDVKTELPAIHAIGRSDFYGYKGEFFFLDDENNPLALKWRLRIGSVASRPNTGGDPNTLQVIKISHHCGGGVSRLEQALLQNGRVDVYDIFFSFNSDEIREESEPTLRDINDILRRHTDWKLSISGHTDNVASDSFNFELSQRRAVAVKNALVGSFGIDAGRLTTSGYGKSRPVDTNDTEEGRARNRRVELMRVR